MKIITINSMWCPACLVMHKIWNKIKEEYTDIEFINYDYDLDEQIVKSFNPGDILPITIFIVDEVEVYRLNGEKTVDDIKEILNKYK